VENQQREEEKNKLDDELGWISLGPQPARISLSHLGKSPIPLSRKRKEAGFSRFGYAAWNIRVKDRP